MFISETPGHFHPHFENPSTFDHGLDYTFYSDTGYCFIPKENQSFVIVQCLLC